MRVKDRIKKEHPLFAFLDVETTGLYAAQEDRVCEIAILRCRGRRKMDDWQSLVNPGRPVSPGAFAVNGISEEMLAGAPAFSDIADHVLELIRDAVVVCHNVRFDLEFLSTELERCGRKLPPVHTIDTLYIARRYFDFPSNNLGMIASYLNIDKGEAHRAMGDVATTQKIFDHFMEELEGESIRDISEIITPYDAFSSNTPGAMKKENPLSRRIQEAITGRRIISLRYLSRSGSETKRVVQPLRLITGNDCLCLEAFCRLRNERRFFRLDRIISVEVFPV